MRAQLCMPPSHRSLPPSVRTVTASGGSFGRTPGKTPLLESITVFAREKPPAPSYEAAFAAPMDWFGGSVAAEQRDDQLR